MAGQTNNDRISDDPPVQQGGNPGSDGLTSGNASDTLGDPVFGSGFEGGGQPAAAGQGAQGGSMAAQARQGQQGQGGMQTSVNGGGRPNGNGRQGTPPTGQQGRTGQQPNARQGQNAPHPAERGQQRPQNRQQKSAPANGRQQGQQGGQQSDAFNGEESLFGQPEMNFDDVPPAIGVQGEGRQEGAQAQSQRQNGAANGQPNGQQDGQPNGTETTGTTDPQTVGSDRVAEALENGELPENLSPEEAVDVARYYRNQAVQGQETMQEMQERVQQYEEVAPIVQAMHNDPGLMRTVSEYLEQQQAPAGIGEQNAPADPNGPFRAPNGQFAPNGQQGQQRQGQQVPEKPTRPERPSDADPYSPEMEEYHKKMEEYNEKLAEWQDARFQAQQQKLNQTAQQLQQGFQQLQQQKQQKEQRSQAVEKMMYEHGLSREDAQDFVNEVQNAQQNPNESVFSDPEVMVQAWRMARDRNNQQGASQGGGQPNPPNGNRQTAPPPNQRQQQRQQRGGRQRQGYDQNPPHAGQQSGQRPVQNQRQGQQQPVPEGPYAGQNQTQQPPPMASGQSGQGGGQPQGGADDLFNSNPSGDPVWGNVSAETQGAPPMR